MRTRPIRHDLHSHGGRPGRWSCALLAACALAGTWACAVPPSPRTQPASPSLFFEGLSVAETGHDGIHRKLAAEQLLVVPMTFGPFQFGQLQELVLTRAHLELHVPEDHPTRLPDGARAYLPGGLGAGATWHARLAGVAIYRLDLDVLRGGQRQLTLSAERADLDLRRAEVVLRDLVVTNIDLGRELKAARATWRTDLDVLEVRGAWAMTDGGRTSSGYGLRTGLALAGIPGRR